MSSLHGLTLGDVLREHRRSRPDRVAAVDGDVRLTYAELDQRVNRLANGFVGAGVGSGDRIVWLGQNSFRLLECLLAAAKLGAYFCATNWRQSGEETAFVLDDLSPALVVHQAAEIGETVRAARELSQAAAAARWVQHDNGEYEALLGAGSPSEPDLAVPMVVDPNDPVLLMYTAAFSGRPNAAMLSHRALIGQALIIGRLAEIDAEYVYLNCGPLFHIATFFSTLATYLHGGTNVFTPRVAADELCRLIQAERCTGAFLLPPTTKRIRELNADGRYNLKTLRGYPGATDWNEMITVDTSPWVRYPGGYGQTEVVGMLTFAALGTDAIGMHGRTSPLMQLRIVDPDDRELVAGEVGEICARGPLVMNGYWNRPQENADRFRNGWHHTNDLGRRESDGSLTFIGPKTRMIKSAAENIYPAEVEGCLKQHPAIADVAVIGVPDPTWTQSVKAIVVLREGMHATEEEIISYCRDRIASYKKPKHVEFVGSLPRHGFAIDYDALDVEFHGGGYPGAATGMRA
jgi:acyl-CoA synthetase (AMP-forming)/AMP-acid ligase II